MIVVIQCASSKHSDAGRMKTSAGNPVNFVADPQAAPPDANGVYARPDDATDIGGTWRDALLAYNRDPEGNPLGLFEAWRLYENSAYSRLAETFRIANVYILSAGWGLIRSDFLTPYYDITFSYVKEKDRFKRRGKKDRYADFRMLPPSTTGEIVFFGGQEYVPHFCRLTDDVRGKRTVVYNSAHPPDAPRCALKLFKTNTRTNWQYEAVTALLDGTLRV